MGQKQTPRLSRLWAAFRKPRSAAISRTRALVRLPIGRSIRCRISCGSPIGKRIGLYPVGTGSDVIASIDEAPAYIMSCSEVINSHFIGYFLQKRPFQVVVAQGTGNRGMTCHIFVDEIVNDGFPKVSRTSYVRWGCSDVHIKRGRPPDTQYHFLFIKAEGDAGYFVSCILQ